MATKKTAATLHIAQAPKRRWHIGEVGSDELQLHAQRLYPVATAQGELVLATRWIAAIDWLRRHSRTGWHLDDPINMKETL